MDCSDHKMWLLKFAIVNFNIRRVVVLSLLDTSVPECRNKKKHLFLPNLYLQEGHLRIFHFLTTC
jgi:hypothetical protein